MPHGTRTCQCRGVSRVSRVPSHSALIDAKTKQLSQLFPAHPQSTSRERNRRLDVTTSNGMPDLSAIVTDRRT